MIRIKNGFKWFDKLTIKNFKYALNDHIFKNNIGNFVLDLLIIIISID